MKICMLTSGHGPLDDRIFYKEVLTLKREYKDITIIAQHDKEYDEIDGIKIVGIPKRESRTMTSRIKTLAKLYKKGLEVKADIYHCHEPDALFIGYKLRKKINSRLIYDCHEYYPENFANHFKKWIGRLVQYLVYKCEGYLAGKCDYVITVNQILFSKFSNFIKNVIILPNFPRLSLADAGAIEERDMAGLVYAGVVCEENGCKKILEALSGVDKSVRMTFVGPVSDEFLVGVKNLIPGNRNSNVNFIGKIEHTRVFNVLAKNIIGFAVIQPVNDVYANCQPIKLFEYMACGLAVIAGDYPLIREMIDEAKCGTLVNPEDENQIRSALIYMLENLEETLEMGKRGRKAIEDKYNWVSIENKLLEVYRGIGEKINETVVL